MSNQMYVVGKKSDLSKIYTSGSYAPSAPPINIILDVSIKNFGGTASDYSVLYISDGSTIDRVLKGQSFILVWSGSDVTGIDFATEDSKKWIRAFSNKQNIIADGLDAVVITFQVWNSDLSAVDTTVSTSLFLPYTDGISDGKLLKVDFSKGEFTGSFSTKVTGVWSFPALGYTSSIFRLDEQYVASVYSILVLN